jgi:mevalonate kinase
MMLMGEHAVLFSEPSIVCAVDKRLDVRLTARADDQVNVVSALGQYHATLSALHDDTSLTFVVSAIRHLAPQLTQGFDLHITAGFSHTVGLGSSAAVTVGVVAALLAYVDADRNPNAVFDRALAVLHDVQHGRGSGADLAASIYGGVIGYQVTPRRIETLAASLPLALYYVGYKMKTPDVLAHVEAISASQPEVYASLYSLMGEVTHQAYDCIARNDIATLGRLLNTYHGLLCALGVSDANLDDLVHRLRAEDSVLGAKISGSGLGDCVVALGHSDASIIPYKPIPMAVAPQGVHIEVV